MPPPAAHAEKALNLAELPTLGCCLNSQVVTEYDIRLRTADGARHVFKMSTPTPTAPEKHFQPAVMAKAAEVLEFLQSQAGPISRKALERKYQNGERGGKLNSVFAYLKSTGKLVISDGYYTDDRAKFASDVNE